ncbi:MAG: TetR/AcrR family transcriptional regulator [Novosphingobium sp.]
MAVSARRIGAESSATRALILEAAELVMVEDGYAATSTRRVAARAGLKPSLVHYYFPTTDDLLIAVYRRAAEWANAELEKALADPEPLIALWRYTADTTRTALTLEFMAMATHREVLRSAMSEHAGQTHRLQLAVIERALGDKADEVPPAVLVTLISALGRSLVMEDGLGVSEGHVEASAWFEDWLRKLAGGSDD